MKEGIRRKAKEEARRTSRAVIHPSSFRLHPYSASLFRAYAASFGAASVTDAVIAPPAPVPKFTLNSAQSPTAVERTAWILYVTVAVPAGIVVSWYFFSPTPPRYPHSPTAPARRKIWYSVPVDPTGLLHFHPSSIEPSPISLTLKLVDVPGAGIGDGTFRTFKPSAVFCASVTLGVPSIIFARSAAAMRRSRAAVVFATIAAFVRVSSLFAARYFVAKSALSAAYAVA